MRTCQWLLNTLTAAILVGLGACGGGGGDDEPIVPAGPTIEITVANRDTVAHATAAGVAGLSPTSIAPLSTGSSGRLMSVWLQPLSARVASALTQRERAQTAYGPYTYQCAISGTWGETDYDNDDDGLPSAGDVITIFFNNCQDAVGETANGSMTMTFTALSTAGGSADVTMAQMSYATSRHTMTFDGAMLLDYTPGTVEIGRATAKGPMKLVVSTHLPFTDTVTLHDGFVVEEQYDTLLERTTSTTNGLLESAAANGVVRVTTMAGAPIAKNDTDDYPYAGTVQVKGMNSTLQMTVLSTSNVRLDLDADGNGSFESTETVAWDWLL